MAAVAVPARQQTEGLWPRHGKGIFRTGRDGGRLALGGHPQRPALNRATHQIGEQVTSMGKQARTAALAARLALAVVGGLALGGQARAFGGPDASSLVPVGNNGCQVVLFASNNLGTFDQAEAVLLSSGPQAVAGGTIYAGPIQSRPPAITVSALQSCNLSNVTNLAQDGATGPYATDAYMGFSFRATDPADGKTYDYEFALKGAANTQAVVTKTLYVAPPATSSGGTLVRNLQSTRMNQLIANQPDLVPLLDGDSGPQVSMAANDGTGDLGTRLAAGPFWAELSASWADAGTASSRYVLGSVGAHTKLSDNAALGLMAEFDHISQNDPANGSASGNGWLVGPYLVARMPGHELAFDARALWGRTDNDITPTGGPGTSVDGIRSLLMVRASTKFDMGAYAVRPRLALARAREGTGLFTDGLGATVPGITSTINQGAVGVALSRDITTSDGRLSLSTSLDGIWTNTTSGPDAAYEDGRGRLGLGLNYVTDHGGTFAASAFVDGLGQDGYQGRGFSLGYSLDF